MDNIGIKKGLKMAALVALYIMFFGTFVMALWNWLMPTLFNLPMITFSQALGLFVLGRILTGGFKVVGMNNLGGDKDNWEQKKQLFDKWDNMSSEDREKWRDEWREKCHSRRLIGFHKKEKDDEPKKPDMI
jgi:Na+/H+-translocating membrane pyrophosphatase